MNTFMVVKHVHLLSVALVGLLFLVRSVLLVARSPALQAKLLSTLAHVFSFSLLLSGVALAVLSGHMQGWMLAKLVLLFVFIGVGVFTFKRASSRAAQLGGVVVGLLIYAYIISIAVTKMTSGFFG